MNILQFDKNNALMLLGLLKLITMQLNNCIAMLTVFYALCKMNHNLGKNPCNVPWSYVIHIQRDTNYMHAHQISCTCFYTCFTYLLSRLELICKYVGALTTLLYRLYPYSYILFTKADCGTKFTSYKTVYASIDAAFIFCTLKYISHYFEIPQRCISIYIFRNMKS